MTVPDVAVAGTMVGAAVVAGTMVGAAVAAPGPCPSSPRPRPGIGSFWGRLGPGRWLGRLRLGRILVEPARVVPQRHEVLQLLGEDITDEVRHHASVQRPSPPLVRVHPHAHA